MDKQAFGKRALLYQTRLYGIAQAILSQPYDAQDAVQDALILAWEHRLTLRNEAFFETWLTRILINRCKHTLRERAMYTQQPVPELDEPREEIIPDIDLRRALDALDVRYRLPLVMHCVLDMNLSEVAKALSIPYGAAKWRVYQAKKLAQKYYDEGGRKS